VPLSPSQGLLSLRSWIDLRPLDLTTNDVAPREQDVTARKPIQPVEVSERFDSNNLQSPERPLMEASRWSTDELGQIELIAASATDNTAAHPAICLTAASGIDG